MAEGPTVELPMTEPADLLALLERLGIQAETHRHEAVFTVAQSGSVKAGMPGAHSKNLFLKDRKDRLFLVVAKDDTAIHLKRLHETIGASGRLSFASADLLVATLGVTPGSVTPFGLVNDVGGAVTAVLDSRLMRHGLLNFHPLLNTMTTAIASADLLVFLSHTGHEPQIVDLPAPPATTAQPVGDCMAGSPPPS